MIQKGNRYIVTILVWAGIILLGAFLFQYTFIWSYPAFLEQERKSASQFEQRNLEVFQKFPPPPGVREATRSSRLLSSYNRASHGARLFVQYNIEQNSMDQIFKYYQDRLEGQGWIQSNTSHTDWRWYHQKSCFLIENNEKKEYEVIIYQDYLSQPFSPKMPFSIDPGLILGFHELFETIIDACP